MVYRPAPVDGPAWPDAVRVVIHVDVRDADELEAVLERIAERLPRRGVRLMGVETPLRT